MNKRQIEKKTWKVALFSGLDDVYCKCYKCQNFKSGDMSVGLTDGCCADFLYDENGNIVQSHDNIITNHMSLFGYTCPYFSQMIGTRKYPNGKYKHWFRYSRKFCRGTI